MPRLGSWRAWETECLKRMYPNPGVTVKEIAEHLNRNVNQVRLKASRLGLRKQGQRDEIGTKNVRDNILYTVMEKIKKTNSVRISSTQQAGGEKLRTGGVLDVMHLLDPVQKRVEREFLSVLCSVTGWDCFWHLMRYGATTTEEIYRLYRHKNRSIRRQMNRLKSLGIVHTPTRIDDAYVDQGAGPKPYVWALKEAPPEASREAWARWREHRRVKESRPRVIQAPLDPKYQPVVQMIADKFVYEKPTRMMILQELRNIGVEPRDRVALVTPIYQEWKSRGE